MKTLASYPVTAIVLAAFTLIFSACELIDSEDTLTNIVEKSGCTHPDSFNYDPEATTDDGSCHEMYGCTGFVNGFSNSGIVTNTFGSDYYDQKMTEEIRIQSDFFGCCPATVQVLIEPSFDHRNAYATRDGRILYGKHMFDYTIQQYGELAAAGVLAHEWGHQTQFNFGWDASILEMELEADALSGFYMALAKQWAWTQIEGYYRHVYASGNYNFNHPNFHGTPEQRLAAAYLGVQVALYAMENGVQFSHTDLHTFFTSEIQSKIIGKNGRVSGNSNSRLSIWTNSVDLHEIAVGRQKATEIMYPEGLTANYVKSLFPLKN